jgi:hypothetical protein
MKLVGAAVTAAATVGVAEAVVRRLSERLPEARLWHDPVAQLKVGQMEARRRAGEVRGVVFAGSSQVLEGVLPSRVAPELGRRAYNAALHRGFLPLTERWLLDEVLPRLRPRLVVLGVGVLDLTDNGVGQYEVLERFEASAARRDDPRSRLRRLACERSALVRHGLPSRAPTVVLRDLRIGPEGEGLEFADATEYRLSEKKRDYIEGELLADYDTGPKCLSALGRIVDGIRAQGAAVVVVELSHTDELLPMLPGGAARVDRARRELRRVLGELEVRLVDDLAGTKDHEWYADCIHFNGAGMQMASDVLRGALAGELEQLS